MCVCSGGLVKRLDAGRRYMLVERLGTGLITAGDVGTDGGDGGYW